MSIVCYLHAVIKCSIELSNKLFCYYLSLDAYAWIGCLHGNKPSGWLIIGSLYTLSENNCLQLNSCSYNCWLKSQLVFAVLHMTISEPKVFLFCVCVFLFCGSVWHISFLIHLCLISKSSPLYFETYLFLRTEVLLYPFYFNLDSH